MLFSLEWLAELVELPGDVDEVCRRLTDAGFNVEARREQDGDTILDVDVTTNRPDCMSHLGLARELAVAFDSALTGAPLTTPSNAALPIDDEPGSEPLESVPVAVEDFDRCPRYAARLVRGVTVGPSPGWLARRLESIGQRPINNVVDVTNYVLWELGQPLHGFDLAKLAGPRIEVRMARRGERLTTLDGEARELDPEILVIADAAGPVALAGIMGGLDSEVTAATTDVLVESAHFEPLRVRMGARRLGVGTDASHRFERGTDPEICLAAATRAAELIAELAGGAIAPGAADARRVDADWRLHGAIESDRLDGFAGVEIPDAEVVRILDGLGYSPEEVAPGAWHVRVPSWRYYDREALKGTEPPTVWEADVYEEVMRHFGFASIPSDLPPIGAPDEGSSAGHHFRESIRRRLAGCGLAEAINYGFYSEAADDSLPRLVEGAPIALANPLSENFSLMRRSLAPGLVESASFNARRGAEAIRLFEIGHVFAAGEDELETVALVCGGHAGVPWDRAAAWDFFALKGVVDELAGADRRLRYQPADLRGLTPGAAAEITDADGRRVGFIGRLADGAMPYPVFVAELRTDAVDQGEAKAVRPPSRFPGIQADATLTHSLDIPWDGIAAAIVAAEVPDLVDFGLKDRYCGEGVPPGAVNTTIFFRYNAADRSLTQEEVNERHQRLAAELEERFGLEAAPEP
jgi:phenylalanyl-tRNA synthetase beta chain